jgi:hypothetical protein
MSSNTMNFMQRLHSEINIAIWSILAVFLIVFFAFLLPHVRAAQAFHLAAVDAEIFTENNRYCERWGFHFGTNEYRSCLDDLQQLRASIAKRLDDDMI